MRTLMILSVFALTACSGDALINAAYPDRARFEFLTSDQDTILSWACENGPTAAETESRAKAAHQYMDGQITAVSEQNATRLMDSVDAGQSALGAAFEMSRRIDAQMEVVVEQTEARFQCVMYESVELT